MTEEASHYWTLGEAAAAIAAGSCSSVSITEAALARIQALDPSLGAFYTVFAEAALAQAQAADAEIVSGRHRGRLHGVPSLSRISSSWDLQPRVRA